ncbi:MAG: hypothetical protein V1835_07075 [Candidatus Micrarchaeota archaeon]
MEQPGRKRPFERKGAFTEVNRVTLTELLTRHGITNHESAIDRFAKEEDFHYKNLDMGKLEQIKKMVLRYREVKPGEQFKIEEKGEARLPKALMLNLVKQTYSQNRQQQPSNITRIYAEIERRKLRKVA